MQDIPWLCVFCRGSDWTLAARAGWAATHFLATSTFAHSRLGMPALKEHNQLSGLDRQHHSFFLKWAWSDSMEEPKMVLERFPFFPPHSFSCQKRNLIAKTFRSMVFVFTAFKKIHVVIPELYQSLFMIFYTLPEHLAQHLKGWKYPRWNRSLHWLYCLLKGGVESGSFRFLSFANRYDVRWQKWLEEEGSTSWRATQLFVESVICVKLWR